MCKPLPAKSEQASLNPIVDDDGLLRRSFCGLPDDGQLRDHGTLQHWLKARVPGSSPVGDGQLFFRLFPFVSFPQTSEYLMTWGSHCASLYVKCVIV